MAKTVELGFVEKCPPVDLLSHRFPSKIGGKPAWLYLDKLPQIESLACFHCENPCSFLLQVYSPIDDNARCFHRTVYVFICKNPKCDSQGSQHVIRSQLSRINEFYDEEPPNTHSLPRCKASDFQSLCEVCGCAGKKKCGKCRIPSYCSKNHQTTHWRATHRKSCGTKDELPCQMNVPCLFPEFELVTETEELEKEPDKSEAERMAEFNQAVKDTTNLADSDSINKDLEAMAKSEEKEDEIFQAFQDRISHDPDQVIRYQRGGIPLLVSEENQPKPEDIPPCSCGQPRVFEFQIMPQLLNHLDVDSVENSLDWGTLLIYTCAKSCQPSPEEPYVREYLWKQDFSKTNTVT